MSSYVAIRRAVAAKLLSVPAITSVVGQRVRPWSLAQDDTFPAISFRMTSAGYEPGISGSDELPSPQFQIVCWARVGDDAAELADVVIDALEDEGPDTWSPSSGDVAVTAATLLESNDVSEEDFSGGDKPVFGVVLTFEFQFRNE
jgi:hypothetical protein